MTYECYQTCKAMPEQYDVISDGETVGYLRLRHGYFAAYLIADIPTSLMSHVDDNGWLPIYSMQMPNGNDGSFSNDKIRAEQLHKACSKIHQCRYAGAMIMLPKEK